ncbi:hypothetical protein OHR68_43095 [Spirillospora sp. NBC_00431]
MVHAPTPQPENAEAARPTDPEAERAQLLVEFPEWVPRYEGWLELPWEAHRRPFRGPVSGCFAWIRAESAERLREMLTATQVIEAAWKRPEPTKPAGHDGRCVR